MQKRLRARVGQVALKDPLSLTSPHLSSFYPLYLSLSLSRSLALCLSANFAFLFHLLPFGPSRLTLYKRRTLIQRALVSSAYIGIILYDEQLSSTASRFLIQIIRRARYVHTFYASKTEPPINLIRFRCIYNIYYTGF